MEGKKENTSLFLFSVIYVMFPNMQLDIITAGIDFRLAKEKIQSALVEFYLYFEVNKVSNILKCIVQMFFQLLASNSEVLYWS